MKTVCIVGLAPSTRELIAQEPDGVEMWCLNMGHAIFPQPLRQKFTRWFQVHPYAEMAPRQEPRLGHLEWLRQASIPVYMEEVHPEIPASVRYPYEAVCQTIGGNYLTSAPSFMLALAIHEGFELIKLYGIDMHNQQEWSYERPCFEYLLGLAIGRGIRVWMPESCPLLKGAIYAKTVDVPSSYLVERYRQLQGKHEELIAELNQVLGKLNLLEQIMDDAFKGPDRLGAARVGQLVSPDGEVSKVDPLGIMGGNKVRAIEAARED